MHAEKVGKLIGKQDLIGIPFAGGLSELPHMNSRQILVNDKHKELFNLYWALKTHPSEFIRVVKDGLYHPGTLENARQRLQSDLPFDRACGYFVVNWLTRCSGGEEKEGEGSLAMRWTASGGSSIARWNSAVDGLPKWAEILRTRCECTCLDWREFIEKWNDRKGHAIYLDPPWIEGGEKYVHKFTTKDHTDLAIWAGSLKETAIVLRHSDHPLYREMYQDTGWEWVQVNAKNQAGNSTGEVLIRKIRQS